MANLRTVTPSAFRSDSERDPSELPKCLERMQKYLLDQVEYDCRNFADAIAEWRDNELWRHFSDSWASFVAEHIKQPLDWIDHMIQGVSILDTSKPITATDAVEASRLRAVELAAQPKALNQGKRTDLIKDSELPSYKKEVVSTYGETSDYLAAVIARDRPDIQERMKAGEFPSVRAAAVEAGIVKPRQQFTVGHSTAPMTLAESMLRKLDREFLVELVAILTEELAGDE